MSLQVWLPLTRDLRQQGLSDVTVTNNGATYSTTGGKLGGTYTFNGSSNYLTVSKGYFGANYSYSLWFYTTSTSATQNLGCCRNSVGEGFAIFLIGGKIRIDGGGTGDATQWVTNYTFSANTWTHLTVTCANGVLKFYINGIYQGTKTITLTSSKWGTIYSVGASQASGSGYGNFLNGKINDVRIYDHCLSPMEVKELAKGLVLHYPLNRNGWGQENLLSGNNAKITTWTNYMPNSVTLTGEGYDNKYTLIKGIGGWEKIFTDAISVTNGETYTLSFDYSVEQNYTGYSGQFGLSICTTSQDKYGADSDIITKVNFGTVQKDKSRTSVTFTATSNVIYLVANGGYISDGQENISFYISYLKLEKGSVATPWCPNSSDVLATTMGLNSITEYDCSGFCNNGEKIGTLTYTSNTPKYSVSTHITNGANTRILTPSLFFPSNAVTLSIWFRSTNTSPTGNYHMIVDSVANRQWYEMCINNTGYFRAGLFVNGTRRADNCTSTTGLNGKWHMLTMTYDGTTIKRYFDGVMENSTTTTASSGLSTPTALMIGRDGPSASYACVDADLSDFRIYATALSAEDVKSLYQNSAYIDSSGNVYGAVHTEV